VSRAEAGSAPGDEVLRPESNRTVRGSRRTGVRPSTMRCARLAPPHPARMKHTSATTLQSAPTQAAVFDMLAEKRSCSGDEAADPPERYVSGPLIVPE
jgi:hypothetical protein